MRKTVFWICGLALAVGSVAAAPAPAGEGARPSPPPAGALADETRLTLPQAARAALEGFPAVAAARAQERAAQAALAEAEAARRPTLSLGANATQYQEPTLVTPIHGFDFESLPDFERTLVQGRLQASYTLYEGGAREARIRQRTAEREAAGVSLSATKQATVARVAAGYLEVLSLVESLSADRARIVALEGELARVEQLLEVGRAAEVDRKRVEASLAAARAGEATRAARLDTSERALARLMGAEPAQARADRLAAVAAPQVGPPEREELARAALAASPEVEEARRRLTAADAALALAESGRRLRLELVAQELGFGSSQGDFTGEWNAGVQLSVPLYTGGTTASRIARAQAAREAAAAAVQLAELEVNGQLDEALARLEEAAARRHSLEAAVASFAEVVRIEKLRLEAEVGVQTDYLEAEAQLRTARADLAEARYREIGARVELAWVLGRLTPEWLASSLVLCPSPSDGTAAPSQRVRPLPPPGDGARDSNFEREVGRP